MLIIMIALLTIIQLKVIIFGLVGDLTSTGAEIVIPKNHFRPDHSRNEMRPPPGHDTQKFYLSPSIKYAGLEVYAPAWG